MKTLISVIAISSIALAGFGFKSNTKQIKVAIIDTGIDKSMLDKDFLCKEGHKDLTGTGLHDNHGHGTHIAGLIEQYAKDVVLDRGDSIDKLNSTSANFCLVIIKYYDPKSTSDSLNNSIEAIEWAIKQHVDVINYSAGGTQPSALEKQKVIKALNKGIKFIAAAGNESSNIDKVGYYPAKYDRRIYIVGSLVESKVRSPSALRDDDIATTSNWGLSVNTWEVGTNVQSRFPGKRFGKMSGTSQACAIKTGKIVREMLQKQ